MIIANCGYGCSGASAIFDFLKGYKDIAYSPEGMEFDLIHQPDGLLDLKYFLCINKERISCNTAIKRFEKMMKDGFWALQMRNVIGSKFDELTMDYIKSIKQISWYGRSIFDPSDVSSVSSNKIIYKICSRIESYLSYLKGKQIHFPKDKIRYFSLLEEGYFNNITKKFIVSLLEALGINKQNVILDMLFSATNPNMGKEFFDNVKTIVVERDPRCMYLRARKYIDLNTYMPCYNVDDFIKYYKILKERETICDDVLYVNYDRLVYEYFDTTKEIIDFLGFNKRPENEFKYFNPNLSVKYTYPYNKENNDEIKKIEQELPQYCYHFPEYKELTF